MRRGDIFIISAPSGAGKTTLINGVLRDRLADHGGLAFAISHTTRKPRAGERDGVEYHFVDGETFRSMVAAGAFLEWARVHGGEYGTAWAEVRPRIEEGLDVLLDIDVQGMARVVETFPEAHSIFILPPSYQALEERLRRRGLDDPVAIERRLAESEVEIRCAERYDYVIINDDARMASDALAAIILEKRHRRTRIAARVEEVLASFEAASARRAWRA